MQQGQLLHAGIAPEVRSPPVAPAETAPAAVTQLGPQATASPASKLRSKYGQLTDLLQNTALQRGISLSQVPIPPTHKPGTGQQKRVSLEEVRTSFKSFTTASSVAASSKPAPLRRVSTGAITPAFLKEKHKQDKALLESLGVADAAAEVNSDAAADAAAPSWAPKQSGRTYLVDETPAVFTRGKGWNRPTGSSFDIKMQHVDTSDEVSSGADGNAADPDSTDAGQAIAHNAGQGVSSNAARISNTGSAVEQTGVNSIYKATSKGSSVQSIQVSHAKQLDAHLEQQSEYTGDPQAAVMKDPVPKLSKKQEALDDTQKLRLTSVTDDDGIKSSGVKVDIISAHKTTEKKVDAAGVSQQAGTAQNSTTSKVQPMQHKSFAHRFCCVCCSTKD